MGLDKTNGTENITETLSGVVGSFSKKLKEFMDQLMGPINKMLEERGFKEKIETQEVIDNSKIDLKKLMEHIKNKEDDKAVELINKSEIFEETITRLNKNDFGKETKEKELTWILSLFKEKSDDKKIDKKELELILGQVNKNRKDIEEEDKDKNTKKEGLKFMIKQINNDKNIKKYYSIKEIISAYKKIKQKVEDGETNNGVKIILNKESIKTELKKIEE